MQRGDGVRSCRVAKPQAYQRKRPAKIPSRSTPELRAALLSDLKRTGEALSLANALRGDATLTIGIEDFHGKEYLKQVKGLCLMALCASELLQRMKESVCLIKDVLPKCRFKIVQEHALCVLTVLMYVPWALGEAEMNIVGALYRFLPGENKLQIQRLLIKHHKNLCNCEGIPFWGDGKICNATMYVQPSAREARGLKTGLEQPVPILPEAIPELSPVSVEPVLHLEQQDALQSDLSEQSSLSFVEPFDQDWLKAQANISS